ncbi:MAG: hypothetical protein K2K09_06205 [Lachnospiraceae bacterium]|nr:hypothetical protein [Lachnospiraceae bacterium]
MNKEMVPGTYSIKSGDEVEILNYYTLMQALEFMDLAYYRGIKVNNELADENTKIYENFKIEYHEGDILSESLYYDMDDPETDKEYEENKREASDKKDVSDKNNEQYIQGPGETNINNIFVTVNGRAVTLSGKASYLFVDILDFYPFDTSSMGGRNLITTVNGEKAVFSTPISEGDIIEIYWEK